MQASFAMQCPVEQLELKELANNNGVSTIGVTGCGKQAVYKWVSPAGWTAVSGQ